MAVEIEQLEAKLRDEMHNVRALEMMYRASQGTPEGDVKEQRHLEIIATTYSRSAPA
jgi:hypothetical protein